MALSLATALWPAVVNIVSGQGDAAADLVAVTEDHSANSAGCDAVSVFDAASGRALTRGETRISPGRLAGTIGMTTVLATQANSRNNDRFVKVLSREPSSQQFYNGTLVGPSVASHGAIAFVPKSHDILLATARGPGCGVIISGCFPLNAPPYEIARYRLPNNLRGERRLTAPLGAFRLDGVAVETLLDAAGERVHVLTDQGTLYTLDVTSLQETSSPIDVPPVENAPSAYARSPNALHATMTDDRRHVITNRWVPEIVVVDLEARTTRTIGLNGLSTAGGVAVNQAETNRGILAVHGRGAVVLYQLAADGEPTELSRHSLPTTGLDYGTGPLLSLAWSFSGRYLIVGAVFGSAEFGVFEVTDGGRQIDFVRHLTACSEGSYNAPNDVWTPNRLIVAPSPTPTASATTVSTETPAPTASATKPASATPSQTTTVTPATSRIYLPAALSNHCQDEGRHVDVALLIDASSSMADVVRPGYTKLDAARSGAARFIELMREGDQATVVWFNDQAAVEQPLTADKTLLLGALARLQLREFTRLDLGIAAARVELQSARHIVANRGAMVILTDGKANPEPVETALAEALLAKSAGVTLLVVGLGRPEDLDDWALRQKASRADYYYQTTDAAALRDIYEEIAGTIPCGELQQRDPLAESPLTVAR